MPQKINFRRKFFRRNMLNTTHAEHLKEEEYQVEDITRFVTCEYDRNLWLALVMQLNVSVIQLIFLRAYGPSKCFLYPSPPGIL
jgi:hypothetical protein